MRTKRPGAALLMALMIMAVLAIVLTVVTKQTDKRDEHVIEATLTADGDQTILVIEARGMPVEHLADYGAGWQVHVEDLAAHLAGRERCDIETRWDELSPAYQDLAAQLG